ncbi:MAG TPA: SRPBCC family protein [Gemmatimonadaceae bacterium]|nr:SRPBCC family protein [Gemmatimonadaceae bacterium]
MPFQITETFQVEAPVDVVWRYLIDPRQVVECLPGAALTQAIDARTFEGTVKVKVGPIVASYLGRAQLIEVNEGEHRVRMAAEGKESSGAGSAKMTMTSMVGALTPSRSEVRVQADLDVAGKIVQFGRGMIETVNQQLFREFVACVQERLALPAGAAPPPASGTPAGAGASTGSDGATAGRPVALIPLILRAIWARIRRLFGAAD